MVKANFDENERTSKVSMKTEEEIRQRIESLLRQKNAFMRFSNDEEDVYCMTLAINSKIEALEWVLEGKEKDILDEID